MLARQDRPASWRFFSEALVSDINDVQGGTTSEGIHMGAMAGTVDVLQRCYPGLTMHDGVLGLDPCLPPELSDLELELTYRGNTGITLHVTRDQAQIALDRSATGPISVGHDGDVRSLAPGQALVVSAEEITV